MSHSINQYKVGRLPFRVVFADEDGDASLMPSYEPFRTDLTDEPLLFTLTVDSAFKPGKKGDEVGQFDCGGTNHGVYLKEDGGYQIVVSDTRHRQCSLLDTSADFSEGRVIIRGSRQMRQFGLGNSIMMTYAFAAATLDTLLMHSSVKRKEGKLMFFKVA